MLTLGVDTATAWCSLGLRRGGAPLAEVACPRRSRQRDPLVPALERLLSLARVERRGLELVAVALGPGSFTSLRVGLSLAKGLCLGLKLPLVGVASLPLLAGRVAGWPGSVGALISDRAGRAYVGWFEGGQARGAPRLVEAPALRAELARRRPVLLLGPGADALRPELEGTTAVWWARGALNRPSGLDVARAGLEQYLQSGADDLLTLEPLYGTPAALPSPSR